MIYSTTGAQKAQQLRNRRQRAPLMRSGSALAAAVALAGLWSVPAHAQLTAPVSTQSRPVVDAGSIMQMRNSPQVSTIADPAYISDARISLERPTLPRPQDRLPDSQPRLQQTMPQAQPRVEQMIPGGAQARQHQAIASSGGSVTTVGAPAPVVAARADGSVSAQASFNPSSGNATINRSSTKDQVQVTSTTAVINWTTFDTATLDTTDSYINFLPAGTELEFIGTGSDYTVLNRIFGTPDAAGEYRGIAFEGTVTSRLSDAGPIGGNVWFYSPGGILLSSTAAFNVGSLVLSASAIDAINGAGTTIDFTGVTQSDSAVLIDNGATIDALDQGSYVAMVAPRVEQAGTVTVNGSVAYVGAEEAQLTIDGGLFDIAIGLGTEDTNGVVHTGTTTGPASEAVVGPAGNIVDADAQGIYLVAVPKNDALTMLVGGSLGYQPAMTAARTENGTIILSAGANVENVGGIDSPQIEIDMAGAAAGANLDIGSAGFTSDVVAFAGGTMEVVAGAGESISLFGDGLGAYSFDATANGALNFGAIAGGTLDVLGDVSLRGGADRATGAPVNLMATEDTAIGSGPAGTVNISGNLTVDTAGRGRDDFFTVRDNGNTGVGEDAVGGDISLVVSGGGSFTVGGETVLDASAQGGKGELINGSSTGGNISLSVTGATSNLNLATSVEAYTDARDTGSGKIGGNGTGGQGSDSIAGDFSLVVVDGTLDIGNALVFTGADATSGSDSSIEQENTAEAGDLTFSFTGGTQDIGNIAAFGDATSGRSFDAGGNAYEAAVALGALTFLLDGSQTSIAQNFDIFSGAGFRDPTSARTTSFRITNGAQFTVGQDFIYDSSNLKESVEFTVDQGASVDIGGGLILSFFGRTSDIDSDTGVDITLNVDNASLTAGFLDLNSSIENDSFGSVDILGGDINISLTNGALVDVDFVSASTNAFASASGSSATGGNLSLLVDSSTLLVSGGMFLSANGVASRSPIDSSGIGASIGRGGSVDILVTGIDPLVDIGDLSISADGSFGGFDEEQVFVVGPDLANGPDLTPGLLAPMSDHGDGSDRGDGGDAFGGSVNLTVESGTMNALDVSINANGFGESGQSGIFDDGINPPEPFSGDGGTGTGGTVTFDLTGGTANFDSLSVVASGLGGSGAFSDDDIGLAAGSGGDGIGGTAIINANAGSLNVVNDVVLRALGNVEIFDFGSGEFLFTYGSGGFGSGVAGGDAGNSVGGSAIFNLEGTAAVTAGQILVSASAFGGEGGSTSSTVNSTGGPAGYGGSATGGIATFNNVSGSISFDSMTVGADGIGGIGGSSFGSVSVPVPDYIGGTGGSGTGGTATVNLNQDDGSDPTYIISSVGIGGDGGDGFTSGDGGSAAGGVAQLLVNDADINLSAATIDASATGGNGGTVDVDSGTGGAGGAATGGTARVLVTGASGFLSSDNSISLTAFGQGGDGADGGFTGNDFDPAGDGGDGGAGTGGTIEILAADDGTLDLQIDGDIDAQGVGGRGGAGGDAPFFTPGDGGAGGAGTGGTIRVMASTGGLIAVTNQEVSRIELQARGQGAVGGNGGAGPGFTSGLLGGDGDSTGGTIEILANGGALEFTSELIADASAVAFDDERSGATGADATGGSVLIEVVGGGSLNVAGDITADVSAVAATGGGSMAGSGTGGSADLVFAAGTTVDAAGIAVEASGSGGSGGNDGSSGGTGTGGDVSIEIATDVPSLASILVDARGFGGFGGNSLTGAGGRGGDGVGGSASIMVDGVGALLSGLTSLSLDASAIGGGGGSGFRGDAATTSGAGGDGGSAIGGNASFAIAGIGASLTVDPESFILIADAIGGSGGAGGDNLLGGAAGDGGTGGSATGGAVNLEAGSGAVMTLLPGADDPFTLSASGTGGLGGSGGSLDLTNGGTTGAGGDGGDGTGGAPNLVATGGTIIGDDVDLLAIGVGGDGGLGGDDGNATFGPTGNGGDGAGGAVSILTFDGSPGVITLGDVSIDATAIGGGGTITGTTAGGQVTLADASADPAGLITMGSLTVLATGTATAPGTPSLTISSDSGPITVTGGVSADVAGDILFDFEGDGQLLVGGATSLFAGGNFTVTHSNNASDTISLEATGNILAQILGDIDAQAGSILSGNEVFFIAGGDASIDDVRGVPFIQIVAGGNVLLNDALATGPQGLSNFGGIFIEAGRDAFGIPAYDPAAEARITGTVDSYAGISVLAGGNAVFASGSATIANDSISVSTGDDIIVETGASLASGRNPTIAPDPADPFSGIASINLHAGGITNLLSTPLSPIASLVIDGSLDANEGAIVARANAIDGLDGSFTASSLSFDIDDAPSDGATPSDDNGLLAAACLEGNVCLGNIVADNIVSVGQSSNNDVIQLIIEQGTVEANDILVTTRNDIVMGTNGIATTLNAANTFSATSLQGDVDLRDAVISSNQILIEAAGSLLGSASLTSANDIGVTVGDSLFAAVIDTGGELTTVAEVGGSPEGFYFADGSIVIDSLAVGSGDVNYTANGDLIIGSAIVGGSNISLGAGGLVELGFTDTAADVGLDGGTVVFGTIDASGHVTANSGSTIGWISIIAGGDIDMLASGAIDGGDLSAGGSLVLDGGSIVFGSGSAGSIELTSASDILFDHAEASGDFFATAVGDFTTGSNSIITGGNIVIAVDNIVDLGNSSAGGSIDVQGSEIQFASLAAGSTIALATLTTPNTVRGNGDIVGGTLDAGIGLSSLVAIGDIGLTGAVAVSGDVLLEAAGEVSFDTIAADGGIIIGAGGAVGGVSLEAGGSIDAQTPDAIAIDTVSASTLGTGGVSMVGGLGVTLRALSGSTATLGSTNGDIRVTEEIDLTDLLFAIGESVFLRSTSNLQVGVTASAGTIDVETSGNLDVEGADAPGDIRLFSTGGDTVIRNVHSGGSAPTPGMQGTQQVTSGGDVTIFAAGDVTVLDTVTAAGNLRMEAGELVDVQALASGATIDIMSGDIDISASGSIGEGNRTTEIVFTALADDVTLGGENDSGASYEFDNDEFSRVFSSGTIMLNAVGNSTGGAAVTIDDLDVVAAAGTSATGGNIGQEGELFVTGGSIAVIGEAVVTNATADTVLGLAATGDIFLDASTGLLEVNQESGSYTGTILIEASDFYAMTQQAFEDIQGMTIDQIDARLADSDGLDNPEGVIRAGVLDITTVASDVFIQNTVPGTEFDERRGFTVDELFISDPASSPQPIVINGTIGGVTGIDAIPLADISSNFDPGSTINGCLIADPTNCRFTEPTDENPHDNPLKDFLEEEFEEDVVDTGTLDTALVEMREDPLRQDDPLIDEPVTGAGNEDLWDFAGNGEECEPDENGVCVAEPAE